MNKIIPNVKNYSLAKAEYTVTENNKVSVTGLHFDPIIAWSVYVEDEDYETGWACPIGLNVDEGDMGKDMVIYNHETDLWYYPDGERGRGEKSCLEFLKKRLIK